MDKQLSDNILTLIASLEDGGKSYNAFIGADGFVDTILHAVDERFNANDYSVIKTMKEYGERIANASGLATNIELVPLAQKLGGNGPIYSNALSCQNVKITYAGALGLPSLHPVFNDLKNNCVIHSLSEPGYTDAIEFEDGKLMLGKTASMNYVTWENMVDAIGLERLIQYVETSDLFGMENWTMLNFMNGIFEGFLKEVFPKLSADRKRIAFFDLADPAKRTDEDILSCLSLITKFQKYCKTILGINKKEVYELANTVKSAAVQGKGVYDFDIEAAAWDIYNHLQIDTLVVHPTDYSFCITNNNLYHSISPFTKTPKLTTGGGDNYNAGFCMGQLMNLEPTLCLLLGGSTSGYYVRNAKSPQTSDLINFLKKWVSEGTI